MGLIPAFYFASEILNENFKNEIILGVSIPRSQKKIVKVVIFYIWLSICSLKYGRLIKDLSFISSL